MPTGSTSRGPAEAPMQDHPRAQLPARLTPGGPLARTRSTPQRKEERRIGVRPLDPFKVILHNDDHNSMDHVVASLVKSVPSLSVERATEIMMEAHQKGKAIVVICPLELAELYRDRLNSFGLTVTIEQD